MQFLVDPSNDADGHAASTLEQIELSESSYEDLFSKFDIQWYIKCLILENNDELMLMNSRVIFRRVFFRKY